MAASSSGSSSFTSSSLGIPPSNYAQTFASPVDSTFTPNSVSHVSSFTAESSGGQTPLRPLDLGPPGYQATIVLFEGTPNERTVYLGPWAIQGSGRRRVVWQCSYQRETLEHFLPGDSPTDVFPHTLHARHRPYSDPCDLEMFVTFRENHRIRYTDGDGVVRHDEHIEVKYEFTTYDGSLRFQGDVRAKDLANYFDVDVVWTDVQGRTDHYGNVRGLGTIQRIKMWRDRYGSFHTITVFANRQERRHREYQVNHFEQELRSDDRHRTVRLNIRGRRQSAPDNNRSRRPSLIRRLRPSSSHGGGSSGAAGSSSSVTSSHSNNGSGSGSQPEIRYLSIQFSTEDDYRRFLESWTIAQESDAEFHGVPFPQSHYELPSPHIGPNPEPQELEGTGFTTLPPVAEPLDEDIYNA